MCGEYIDASKIEDLLRKTRESDTRFRYIQTILERVFFFPNVNEIVVHIQLTDKFSNKNFIFSRKCPLTDGSTVVVNFCKLLRDLLPGRGSIKSSGSSDLESVIITIPPMLTYSEKKKKKKIIKVIKPSALC